MPRRLRRPPPVIALPDFSGPDALQIIVPKPAPLARYLEGLLHGKREGKRREDGFAALIVFGPDRFISRRAGDNELGFPLRIVGSIEWDAARSCRNYDTAAYYACYPLIRIWCQNVRQRDELEKRVMAIWSDPNLFQHRESLRRTWLEFGTRKPIPKLLAEIERWIRVDIAKGWEYPIKIKTWSDTEILKELEAIAIAEKNRLFGAIRMNRCAAR